MLMTQRLPPAVANLSDPRVLSFQVRASRCGHLVVRDRAVRSAWVCSRDLFRARLIGHVEARDPGRATVGVTDRALHDEPDCVLVDRRHHAMVSTPLVPSKSMVNVSPFRSVTAAP